MDAEVARDVDERSRGRIWIVITDERVVVNRRRDAPDGQGQRRHLEGSHRPGGNGALLKQRRVVLRLSAGTPCVRALVNIFDRLCGSATQQLRTEMEGRLTFEDLIVRSNELDRSEG